MFHSHNEKEVTTDDIFPGGMMTMLIIEPWSVDLDATTGVLVTGSSGSGSSGVTVVEVAAENGPGILNAERTTLDFGIINGSTVRTNTLTLMNTGVAPALLGVPTVVNTAGTNFSLRSTTCTAAPMLIMLTCQITVNFNPSGTNTKSGILTIPYNGSGPVILNLTGQ
jgi:Fe2+ transport system protein FeoA